jgi:hypothetical protein
MQIIFIVWVVALHPGFAFDEFVHHGRTGICQLVVGKETCTHRHPSIAQRSALPIRYRLLSKLGQHHVLPHPIRRANA